MPIRQLCLYHELLVSQIFAIASLVYVHHYLLYSVHQLVNNQKLALLQDTRNFILHQFTAIQKH